MIQALIRKARPGGISLDLELQAGDGVTALFGPRGAGKTATLEALTGLIKPDTGRIIVGGQILFDGAAKVNLPSRLRPCGYVPRGYALFPHLTLRENLVFAAASRRMPRLERHRRVNDLIERFELAEVAKARPAQVDSQQRLRCAIARALVGQPKLLLLDEPAAGLDTPLRAELSRLLQNMQSELGASALVASNQLEDCLELGDEMLVLAAGRVVQSGRPSDVIEQPGSVEVARMLGGFNLLPVEIAALDPVRNTSRLLFGKAELTGPYFPGRFRGNRVTLCVRADHAIAVAAPGRPGPSQLPARLVHHVERPRSVTLHFEGGLIVELSRADYEQTRHVRDWVVELPPQHMRAL